MSSDVNASYINEVELPIGSFGNNKIDRDIEQQKPVSETLSENILEVKNLKMYYPVTAGLLKRQIGTVKAVDNVSFTIKKGETLGIVGESGSGKSTIGNCVMRNIKITDGSIKFNGSEIANTKGKELHTLRKDLTMITQELYASLDPRMMVKDSILEGVRIHKLVKGKGEEEDLVHRMMELVGLNSTFSKRYPHEFSGGQTQRISIARALAMNPSFIVCDEIVSALDVSIQAQIVRLMMKLQEELSLTYIFIGHDLSVVRHMSNNVAVMYLGQFMELSNSDELYQRPLHPYTRALISSAPIPNPRVDRTRERILLQGEIPSPINQPEGCNFSTRCPYADGQCKTEEPSFIDVGNNHFVACHKVADFM